MTITTDNEAFRTAVADLRSVSDRLEADSRHIGREVDALLDGAGPAPRPTRSPRPGTTGSRVPATSSTG